MQLRMWMLDVAREQSPTLGDLRRYFDLTQESGYSAIGLYLEHRFAYPCTPWSHGTGCITPDMILTLQDEYTDLQIIPFINLLGHFEGMIYTEQGKRFREERFKGLQACSSNPEFVELCHHLIDDTISIFKSNLIHIGGDETQQLGACPICKEKVLAWTSRSGTENRVANAKAGENPDLEVQATSEGKARLYGQHFGPLARKVQGMGRRPAVWGDMFLEHPSALDAMPKETLIFDWQYFKSPYESSKQFTDAGFDVVCSPAILTYNAVWCHLEQSEKNVRDHVEAAQELNAHGVCVTTWECGLFGNYETLFPVIRACGQMLDGVSTSEERIEGTHPSGHGENPLAPSSPNPLLTVGEKGALLASFSQESLAHAEWANLMSSKLESVGGTFAFGQIRSSLKCRLLLYSNPFLAWMHHHEELNSEVGDRALAILDHAISIAPTQAMRGVAEFGKLVIEFVRYADQARQAYAQGLPGVAVATLSPCREIFDQLEKIARATSLNIGGSRADIERCRAAKEHVERVIRRIRDYGDNSLGYLPAFEIITHPKFMPHDQASWWLINRWANE